MRLLRKRIGAANEIHVVVRMVFSYFLDQLIHADIGADTRSIGHRYTSRIDDSHPPVRHD